MTDPVCWPVCTAVHISTRESVGVWTLPFPTAAAYKSFFMNTDWAAWHVSRAGTEFRLERLARVQQAVDHALYEDLQEPE